MLLGYRNITIETLRKTILSQLALALLITLTFYSQKHYVNFECQCANSSKSNDAILRDPTLSSDSFMGNSFEWNYLKVI